MLCSISEIQAGLYKSVQNGFKFQELWLSFGVSEFHSLRLDGFKGNSIYECLRPKYYFITCGMAGLAFKNRGPSNEDPATKKIWFQARALRALGFRVPIFVGQVMSNE